MAMQAARSYGAGMKILLIPALLGAVAMPLFAPASAQGSIGTVERGAYVCELPGDAGGPAGVVQSAQALTIESASR